MRSLIVSVLTAGLMAILAGNAIADFTYGTHSSLGLSIYNPTTNVETGYDLGVGLDLTRQNVTLVSGADVSDTDATVALYSTTSAFQSFFGITSDTAPGISQSNIISFQNSVRDVFNIGYVNGASPVTVAASDPKSASSVFGTNGSYKGLVSGGNPLLQPNLNDLASADFIDIYLYQYDVLNLNKGFDPATDYAAIIRIQRNGSVILNPAIVNEAPQILSFTADQATYVSNAYIRLYYRLSDPNGDDLDYTLSSDSSLLDDVMGTADKSRYNYFKDIKAPTVATATAITFSLSVTDGQYSDQWDGAPVTVTVTPASGPTWPPTSVTAAASPSSLGSSGGTVNLTVTALNGWDINDADLQWTWSTTFTGITIANSSAKTASFTAPANTGTSAITIPITLQVSHGQQEGSISTTFIVTVNPAGSSGNNPPTNLAATANPASAGPGTSVALSGSATDPDGDGLSWAWSSPDLSSFAATGQTATFIVPASATAGSTYTIRLKVTDDGTPSQSAEQDVATVTVAAPAGPTANAGADDCATPGSTITLDGSDSTGSGLTYSWAQTGGDPVDNFINKDQAVASFTVPAGTDPSTKLVFSLLVTDGDGNTDTDACNVIVVLSTTNCANLPEAYAGKDLEAWENEVVILDGSGSYANASTVFAWTQLSGSKAISLTGADADTASFTAPDVDSATEAYVFELTLTDTVTGYESADNVVVTVKQNQPPGAPVSALTPVDDDGVWEASVAKPSLIVQNVDDPDGDAVTYEFEVYGYDPAITNPEAITIVANRIARASNVPEGDTTTSWTTPQLVEDTYYWWRARADDGLNQGSWMALQRIFVNAVEAPPGIPQILSPIATGGCARVGAAPTLKVANTTDPDHDQLTYEFRVFDSPDDPIYEPDFQRENVPEGTGADKTTSITIAKELTDNVYYTWRVRAVDDTDRAGGWSEPACFYYSEDNDPPETPVVIYPEPEIDTNHPTFQIEGGTDPEGLPVTLTIALYGESFDAADLIVSSDAIAKSTDSAVTTWTIPDGIELEENTTYRYQVTARDEEGAESETTGTFFVNQVNEPPYTPAIKEPVPSGNPDDDTTGPTTIVTTLTPTLVLTPADPADPDLDTVTYAFEIYLASDLTNPIETESGLEDPQWTVSRLVNGKKYYWRARAVDEHGEPGEWTDRVSFTTGANYYQPSRPELVSPFDNGTVSTLTPTLVVVATADGDNDAIWVEFELYRDKNLTDFVSYGASDIGPTATSWQVDISLEDNTEYFWRARATDGEKYSAWSAIHRFKVDLAGSNTGVTKIWAVGNYDPIVPWYTVIQVDDADSDIRGARVIIPPGALSTSETIYIGVASGAPSFDGDLLPVGKVIDFGPSGIVFNVSVTIKIPYNDQDLEDAGGITPEELSVYTYNEAKRLWERIEITEVDTAERMLICGEVNHFSLYASATGSGGNSTSGGASSGGGGGGGCFITSSMGDYSSTRSTILVIVIAVVACGLTAIRVGCQD